MPVTRAEVPVNIRRNFCGSWEKKFFLAGDSGRALERGVDFSRGKAWLPDEEGAR